MLEVPVIRVIRAEAEAGLQLLDIFNTFAVVLPPIMFLELIRGVPEDLGHREE